MVAVADADVDIANPDRDSAADYLWSNAATGLTVYVLLTADASVAPTATSRYLYYAYQTGDNAAEAVRAATTSTWGIIGSNIVTAGGVASGAAIQPDGTRLAVSVADPRTLRATTSLYVGRQSASDSWFPADIERVLIYWGVVHTPEEQATIRAELLGGYSVVGFESFTKTDGAGLGNDITWSLTDPEAKLATASNVGVLNGITSAEVAARAEIDASSDDMYVELVLPDFGNTSYGDIGLCVRMNSTRDTFYCFKRITATGGVPGSWDIRKYVSDVITELKVSPDDGAAVAFAFPETARIEVEGDEIRGYINGVLIATATDSGITTGSYGGLNGYRNSTASSRRVLFDNFQVGSLGGGPTPINLTVADLAVDHTIDAPTLTQVHVLAVADLTVDHDLEAVSLAQVHVLAVADLTVDHTAEAVSVTQVHELAVSDLAVDHAIDGVTLTQVHELTVADLVVEHSVDSITLSAAGDLTVADLTIDHSIDGVTLTQVHNLAVADLSVDHTVEGVTLTQTSTLTVADLTIAHEVESVTLTGAGALAVADLTVDHTVEVVVLTQVHVLAVADVVVEHTIDTVTLTTGDLRDITVSSSQVVPSQWRSSVVEPPWHSSLVPSSWKSEVLHG